MTVFLTFFISGLLVAFMLVIIKLVVLLLEPTEEKWSSFECGFSSQVPSHSNFSMQFFLIMILFLIFDIEVSLLFPYPLSDKNLQMQLTMFIFVLMLAVGLIVEWKTKKLDWSK